MFIGPAIAHPFVYLGQLEFPQSPDFVCRQTFVFPPTVHGVFCDTQMLGDLLGSNPRFRIYGIRAQV